MIISIRSGKDVYLLRKLPVELVKLSRNADKQLLGKYSNSDIEALIDVLDRNIPKITTIQSESDLVGYEVNVNHNGPHKNIKFNKFTFGPWLIQVSCTNCWRASIRIILDVIFVENKNKFEEVVPKIYGKNRTYFSKDKKDLSDPYRIGIYPEISEWYVETNLSANNSYSLIQLLASIFNYKNIGYQ